MPLIKKPKAFLSIAFALVGGLYTVCEIEQTIFGKQMITTLFKNHIILTVIVILFLSVFLNREKAEFSSHLGANDYLVTLKMADILRAKNSAIVIPTNTTFDTTIYKCFISPESIQGKFQKKYFGDDFSELDKLLQASLDEEYQEEYIQLNDRESTKKKKYNVGTVSKITKNNIHYYFLAVADVSKTGKPQNVTMQSITHALVGLWSYLAREGYSEPVSIPVIGTGRAGLKDGNIEDVVHESIFSFVLAAQEEFIAKGLSIYIYPPSLKDANTSWDNLCDYLKLQCCYASDNTKRAKSSSKIGEHTD